MKKKNFILYVDDTGINPKEKTSIVLQNEKATHAGIIIREDLVDTVNDIMIELGNFLYAKYDTDEFHFTDIYNRNKKFKNIQAEETIEILQTFTELFKTYSIRIVANTINSLYSNKLADTIENINTSLKYIKLPINEKSQSLFFVYTKAKQHVEELTRRAHISQIICDEGLKKKGTVLSIPGTDTKIVFKDSQEDKLLQLADFAAWFMSRTKNIFDKVQKTGKLSELDRIVLDIYSELSPQYIGTQTKLEINDKLNYDEIFNNIVNDKN